VTTPTPPRQRWLDYLPAISLAVVLAGGFQVGGQYISQLKDNTRRIEQLEKDAREDTDKRMEMQQKLLDRTARIETKLELLVPPERKAP